MAASCRPFQAFGVEKATFVSYFTEGIELMKAAWSDEPKVTFHGRFRDVDGLPIATEAGAAAAPAAVDRRHRAQGAGPRGAARRRLHRCGLVDHGDVRQGGEDRPPANSTNKARTQRDSPSASGCI